MDSLVSSSSSSITTLSPSFTNSAAKTIPRCTSLSLRRQTGQSAFSVSCVSGMVKVDESLPSSNKISKEAKLWGGRFEESVTDTVEKFTESISFDKALYKQDIMGSRAHASMLAKQGLISVSDKESILQGLDEIERRIVAGEFVWRSDREDVHMNIEAALTDLIGEPAKKLHTARSRNDQVSTDFRLWCREAIDKILLSINRLQVMDKL